MGTWTCEQQLQQVEHGVQLDAWGIPPGSRVALLLPKGPLAALLLLSTISRYCAVPLSPELPTEGIAVTLSRTRSQCLLVLEGSKSVAKADEAARAVGCCLVLLRAVESRPGGFGTVDPFSNATLPLAPPTVGSSANVCGNADVVLVLSTSGTTGAAKDVMHTLSSLISSGTALANSMRLTPADIGVNMMPLHHVGGIACNLMAPLLSGSRMHFLDGLDVRTWFRLIESADDHLCPTWTYAVPRMWAVLLEHARHEHFDARLVGCSTLRLLRSGAAPMVHSDAAGLLEILAPTACFLPTYSMSECMPIASPPVGYKLQKRGSVGTPVGVKLHIDNSAAGTPAAVGTQGEVVLHTAPQLFMG